MYRLSSLQRRLNGQNSFSRKYRPKKISDVIGQDFAVRTIENAFESKNSMHSYLQELEV